jgi:hypothetical protein
VREIASSQDPGSSELPLRIRGVLNRSAQVMEDVKLHPLIHNLPVLTGWLTLGKSPLMQPLLTSI